MRFASLTTSYANTSPYLGNAALSNQIVFSRTGPLFSQRPQKVFRLTVARSMKSLAYETNYQSSSLPVLYASA
jgi:hypothetical protein